MQTNLMGVEYDIKNATINDQIGIVRNEVQKGLKEIYILEKQGKITNEEANVAGEKWRLELAGMGLKNLLTKAQEDNTIQMTEESKQRILQGWKDKSIQQFSEEIKAEYPSLWNVIGKSINEIYDLVGERDNRNPNTRVRKPK